MKHKYFFLLIVFFVEIGFAQITAIPDTNFEQRLIDMGYDTGPVDGSVHTANISGIISLSVPNSNISDFTGIEDFVALQSFDCIGNPITSLDLSNNTDLVSFFTGQNQLASLNLTNNLALQTLICSGTLLGSLDLSNNTSLAFLACPNSQLTGLDLSNNTLLTNLVASDNLFASLDLSNNTALESLVCTGLLNISPLNNINVQNGNNSILTNVNVQFNGDLSCMEVDDVVAAYAGTGPYSSWLTDFSLIFSDDCTVCPDMDIQGNNVSIVSGDTTPDINDDTDFGIVDFGSFEERIFTITNSQTVDLNLTGSPVIVITNSTDFTVTSQPNTVIAANGGSTTFTLRYEPSMTGTINTANISILNNDCDENPYSFTVMGQSQEPLNLPEYDLTNLKVIPNPSNGIFKLEYEGVDPIEQVNLYNVLGKKLNKEGLEKLDHTFNFSNLNGVYFLEIRTKNSRTVKRLIFK